MLDNIIQKVKCFYKLESGRSVLYITLCKMLNLLINLIN